MRGTQTRYLLMAALALGFALRAPAEPPELYDVLPPGLTLGHDAQAAALKKQYGEIYGGTPAGKQTPVTDEEIVAQAMREAARSNTAQLPFRFFRQKGTRGATIPPLKSDVEFFYGPGITDPRVKVLVTPRSIPNATRLPMDVLHPWDPRVKCISLDLGDGKQAHLHAITIKPGEEKLYGKAPGEYFIFSNDPFEKSVRSQLANLRNGRARLVSKEAVERQLIAKGAPDLAAQLSQTALAATSPSLSQIDTSGALAKLAAARSHIDRDDAPVSVPPASAPPLLAPPVDPATPSVPFGGHQPTFPQVTPPQD